MRQTFNTLLRRLSQAGYKNEFVRAAILPDWWEEACAEEPNLLQDFEIRVARFLSVPLATVSDPSIPLRAPAYPAAQLRRVRDINRDRLGPSIHTAMKVAEAAVRNLRNASNAPRIPPLDGLQWREETRRPGKAITLDDILADLWKRGIPVVPLNVLPAPRFQGMSCIVQNRPVILIGHKNDEPSRLAFLIAHEAGHIAAGDCVPDQPVVDEEEEIVDGTNIERAADRYATRALVGGDKVPHVDGAHFKDLAARAVEIERETGADAGTIISAWAARTGDYTKATLAWKALYRSSGARVKILQYFNRHIDIEEAAETDRDLLRCVYSEAIPHETSG